MHQAVGTHALRNKNGAQHPRPQINTEATRNFKCDNKNVNVNCGPKPKKYGVRKLKKYFNMRQFKIAVLILGASCLIILLMYYWHRSSSVPSTSPHIRRSTPKSQVPTSSDHHLFIGTPMRHVPLNEIYNDKSDDEDFSKEDTYSLFAVDTPGCQIPFAIINYEKHLKDDKKIKRSTCGRRAVFLKKIDGIRVQASISNVVIKKYLRKSAHFDCCYRFIKKSTLPGYENTKNKFTNCQKFIDGDKITLETDFVNVKCFELDARNTSRAVYDDVYAFTKKINSTSSNRDPASCKDKYNVLMLGMDSMSLPRFVQTMPLTTNFFYQNYWLCFRGYHKVGDNTFPNLMAALTGQTMQTITTKCQDKMDECNNILMWSKFKENGYVTAYGEDFLRLPDTFSKRYAFRKPPTDHYIRPFFHKVEKELNNKSLVCAGRASAGKQLLDYAADFVTTYRYDRFFGFFWMNSFSHNVNSRPQDADRLMENFFNKISYTGILENTFIIFFSDHGIRFGHHRTEIASYFDERLPISFLWVPTKFKGLHWNEHRAIVQNQFRLVTPYDLFSTLIDINQLSSCKNLTNSVSHACPNCHSLFRPVNSSRQCQDVAIHDKWCSCHKMYPLPSAQAQDTEGMKSVLLAVSHIKTLIKSIKTKKCWRCMDVSLKNVIRIHFYYDSDKINLYYIVAFTTSPGNMSYEATVKKLQMIGPLSVISSYRGLGHCATESKARLYCVCQKIDNCK